MTLSVCIFAHNEERLLPHCIGALEAACAGEPYEVHILVNGCKDQTLTTANSFAAIDPRIHVHELPVGDKTNAWNEYVFRIAPKSAAQAPAHIFLDGDICPSKDAISALATSLRQHPKAYGAAALPVTGRSRRRWARTLLVNKYISGNLYALSHDAIAQFQEREMHLPFGAKGEDGLITYILLTDFMGGEDDSHTDRIVICEEATFEFESLKFNWRDVMLYHRRLLRYSERHFQKKILYRQLKKNGLIAMPINIADIYSDDEIAELRPRLNPVSFLYDWHILKQHRTNTAQLSAISARR